MTTSLPEPETTGDPLEMFADWYGAAAESGLPLPEAVCLSTATPEGAPSSRMVLLKSFEERGFVFHTNYESRKALEMDANPRAALLFHWATLERQVRIEGSVARLPVDESVAYFATRDRASQLGAWASRQSRELRQRSELEESFQEMERRFHGLEVPLPSFWGGYRLTPRVMEFWQGRPNRLHDRVVFVRDGGAWRARRLYP
jgi:pyridoxamine 5'-phosphate oxidase